MTAAARAAARRARPSRATRAVATLPTIPTGRLSQIAAAVLAAACAVQTGLLGARLLRVDASPAIAATAPPGPTHVPDFAAIGGLFGRTVDASAPSDPAAVDGLSLVATIATPDPERGVAIVAATGGAQHVYRVGDAMPGGASLRGVWVDRVTVLADGALRALAFPRTAFGAGMIASTTAGADAPVAEEPKAENPRFLATVVRDGDEIRGIRVEPAGDPAGFARLKLRSGDVITAIDGKAVTRVREFETAVASLGQYRQPVEVAIRRNGSPAMVYVLPDASAAVVDTTIARALQAGRGPGSAR
jgi:general secretion pathway protein C